MRSVSKWSGDQIMLKLYSGTKKYSSWSLRPWSLLREAAIRFDDVVIPFEATPGSREFTDAFKLKASPFHPSSRVPVLHDGKIVIWESLAICEYLSREYCGDQLWPNERASQAFARSLATEVQSEFALIRATLPFWCTKELEIKVTLTGPVQVEWDRLTLTLAMAMMSRAQTYLKYAEYKSGKG